MKYNHFYSILIFSILVALSNCSPDQDCHGTAPNFRFSIIDSVTESDQIFFGQKYNPDSIKLEVNGVNIISHYIKWKDDFSLRKTNFYLKTNLDLSIYNDSLYYIYLDSADIDTLQIKVNRQSVGCGNNDLYSSIYEVIHNRKDTIRNFHESFNIRK